jgi:O-succinylbenzoate synthase
MKIAEIRLQRYELKLVKPLIIKGHTLDKRNGLIITLIDFDGHIGYGDIAPLPFLHHETMDEAIRKTLQITKSFIGMDCPNEITRFSGLLMDSDRKTIFPSVLFGIEMALFDLYLQQSEHIRLDHISVPICGLINTASQDFCSELEDIIGQEYSAIKIKVGHNEIADEVEKIRFSKEMAQDRIIIRLDANRAWTLKEATAFCDGIGPEGIEYIEEPVKQVSDQKRFVVQNDIHLAIDETLLEERIDLAYELEHISAFVIKPGLAGGFDGIDNLIEIARRNDITPVLSSTFQSGVAIRSLLLFAGFKGLFDIPIGVDTLKWFAEDVLSKPVSIVKGSVSLKDLLQGPISLNESVLTDIT